MKNWLDMTRGRRWGAWNCAVYALLAVVGFVTLNVAGCGGGGGGIDLTQPVTITVNLRNSTGGRIDGTGTINGGTFTGNFTTAGGDATVSGIKPGTYTVTVTVGGTTYTQSITVGGDSGQRFVVIPGVTTGGSGGANLTLVTGRIYLNRGDPQTGRCDNPTIDLCRALSANANLRKSPQAAERFSRRAPVALPSSATGHTAGHCRQQ